jgi:hypothetical protein
MDKVVIGTVIVSREVAGANGVIVEREFDFKNV